jgi:glutathione S-transferase
MSLPAQLLLHDEITKVTSYVLLAATSTSFLNYWLSYLVGQHRKAAKVDYPNAYATANEAATSQEKHLFNCAQRAHANFLEAQPSLVTTLLISGLKYPVLSAAMGASWVFFRILYTIGYTRPGLEKGKGRYRGILHLVPQAALTIMATLVGYKMIIG